MRVLFTILLVAFVGLLWATWAASRHIRLVARRRQAPSPQLVTSVSDERGGTPPPAPPSRSNDLGQRQRRPLETFF